MTSRLLNIGNQICTTIGFRLFMNSALPVSRFPSYWLWPEEMLLRFLSSWSWPSLGRLVFLYTPRGLLGWLLLSLGIAYGSALLTAEQLYQRGVRTNTYSDLDRARRVFPYLQYIAQGPARSGSISDLMRAVREDPRAFDLAAALRQLQPRR